MNYINCQNSISPDEMRKAVIFWSLNTFQHIESLLNSADETVATLQPEFQKQLKSLMNSFKRIYDLYKESHNNNLSTKPDYFFKENQKFINLLERLKFEGYAGFPSLQQTIFHYLYEQHYASAVFAVNSNSSNVLITTKYNGMGNYTYICIFNQMYFWSIIGAMHPSLLLENRKFADAITSSAKEFLINTTNQFNSLNFELSELKKPITRANLTKLFEKFEMLNASILNFLIQAKSNSTKVFTNPFGNGLPKAFYGKLQHMIDEHTMVKELNESIAKKLL